MKKEIFIILITCWLLATLVSCSSFLYTSTNTQENTNNLANENENLNANDTIHYIKCSLLSIKTSAFEILSFPIRNNSSTLKISNNGNFSGFAFCNSFFGQYTKIGNNIKFGNCTMTRKGCGPDENIENIIMNSLGIVDNFSIENKQLLLKKGTEVIMVYQINNRK
jgi:heat shock protein HslJ